MKQDRVWLRKIKPRCNMVSWSKYAPSMLQGNTSTKYAKGG